MSLWQGNRLTVVVLLVAALGRGVPAARAGTVDDVPREYQVKAAFIDRFLNFVEWNGAKAGGDTLVIGIVGDAPMAEAIRTAEAGSGSRHLAVRTSGAPQDLAAACHVIFVSATIDGAPRSAHPQWGDTAWTATHQVLTVGEDDAFTASGGVIGFYTEDDRLRFAVSEGAMAQAGLVIGSKLLRLAKIVP